MAERYRCAPASLARDEPMPGTASRVRSWVLVEQPGPWGRTALRESRLDPEVGEALEALGRRHRARVLLVRRPGRVASPHPRVYLAHTARTAGWLEELDLPSAADLLDLDWSRITAPEPPGYGRACAAPVHLVCTNGRHDACCADMGRPVVRALVAAGVRSVWESSHVGGDRFAANLVSLPSGVYLGRVDPVTAPAVVADLERGLLPLPNFRGRSCDPPLVQVADACARRETGVVEIDGLPLAGVEAVGDDAVRVTFLAPGGRPVRVLVARQRADAATVLTCTATAATHTWSYRVDDLAYDRSAGAT
ncbi:MAG TPA: sucrase ferredoxin [Acidimicrobiales bacterium]